MQGFCWFLPAESVALHAKKLEGQKSWIGKARGLLSIARHGECTPSELSMRDMIMQYSIHIHYNCVHSNRGKLDHTIAVALSFITTTVNVSIACAQQINTQSVITTP